MGQGQRAPGRGAGPTKARQPALIYAACRVRMEMLLTLSQVRFFILNVSYVVLIDVGSTHSYVACSVLETLRISHESTSSEIFVVSPLGQSIRLVKHRVSLDCAEKWVVLRTEEDNEVVVIGERWDYLRNMVFALVAEKLVRKGCEAYLAYISVSDSVDYLVKDIRTVKDFPDVFSEELLGLSASHEVDFGIELIPGTAPL
ncbi:uncharacterized protein [Gossypium hirsutum]|uniref:Uncharacterized protein n=1 Tax=Gossypium hirsutum TaxID=3635 RepID=A0A1U8MVE8_GOSHI|nr:uncharacterized protein LOC107940623 [Gossypium hirsutum]